MNLLAHTTSLALLTLLGNVHAAPNPIDHAYVIILENHSIGRILGNAQMPKLNALAQKYTLATNYYGITHPSMPNYIAMIAGDTYGIRDNNSQRVLTTANLADQLEGAGKTWKAYMQSIPEAGSNADFTLPDGKYAKKHNPFMLFKQIQENPARAKNVVPLEQLYSDLNNTAPNLAFIVPDQCSDMHGAPNCNRPALLQKKADDLVGNIVGKIMKSTQWTKNSVIIITFDEDEMSTREIPSSLHQGGKVLTVVISGSSKGHITSNTLFNHYSLLRGLEEGFGLPLLGNAAQATSLNALFR
jgi:phosphatidylinositol-3-phosphatase